MPKDTHAIMVFDRHIFDLCKEGLLAVVYDGSAHSYLLRSTDEGGTWSAHQVITDQSGFNYTALTEVSPGRLLYLHDAPALQALYVDVARK